MSIELRSDTFTQPTKGMKEAMFAAPLGDDVFGEDPTVNLLEQTLASNFGIEAGLFCPSGTMTNQIAMMVHCKPGDEIICEKYAHVYKYEGGGMMTNAMASPKLIEAKHGIIQADQLKGLVNNPNDPHFPLTRLVCLENTSNQGGGSYYTEQELEEVKAFCKQEGLALHLDGARIYNAMQAAGYSPRFVGGIFDSISVCLSKGLGSPVGSLLLGSAEFINQARRVRKRLGGGMRQAGILAAAGLYSLEHHVPMLKQDHSRAKEIAELLSAKSWVADIVPVHTNILIFNTSVPAAEIVKELGQRGVKCLAIRPHQIRFVFHLSQTDDQIQELKTSIDNI